jgi:long-chain acyl-CoA synthetase
MYVAIMREVGKHAEYLSSIKYCLSGAAPLPAKVQSDFEAMTHGKLVEGYGLSEAGPVTHCNPLNENCRNGSIGLPLPNVDAAILDQKTGEPLPAGEIGEIAVKGPNVMKGYWNREEETAAVFSFARSFAALDPSPSAQDDITSAQDDSASAQDGSASAQDDITSAQDDITSGWMRTGDLGKMDADGYFYIIERAKDLIIASGFNVYPREVEEVLLQHPAVAEAAVAGVPDEYRGETVAAFVVLKPGIEASEKTRQDIVDYCKQHLTAYKVPKIVEFRESLPKSLIGKVLRRELKVTK